MILKQPIDMVLNRSLGSDQYKIHVTVRRCDRLKIEYLVWAIHRNGVKLRDDHYHASKDFFKQQFSQQHAEFRTEIENYIKKWGIC